MQEINYRSGLVNNIMRPSIVQRTRSSVRKPRPEGELGIDMKPFIIGIKGLIREKYTNEASRPTSGNSKNGITSKIENLEERNKVIETENRRLRREIDERRKLLKEKREQIEKIKEELANRKESVVSIIHRSLRRIEEEEAHGELNVMDYPDSLRYFMEYMNILPTVELIVSHSITTLGRS